jgi:hypothetical protein
MSETPRSARPESEPSAAAGPPAAPAGGLRACAVDPDVDCPVCAARGERVQMLPIKAHYQCPRCRYFDSCCM